MKSLNQYFLDKEYARVEKLAWIDPPIDWEAFRHIIPDMYDNRSEHGGRPNIDETCDEDADLASGMVCLIWS